MRTETVTEPKFSCPSLRRPILKRGVSTGKEYELYLGSQAPGEKVDSCPKATSEVFAWPKNF